MPFFRSVLGFVIAGITPTIFWGAFTNNFGGLGGWLAAFFLIGTLWYVNHHLGLIENKTEAGFIDMGLGIAICGTTNGVLTNGPMELINSLPTLILVSIGGAIGGITAALIKKND
jgi:hypothetical protein